MGRKCHIRFDPKNQDEAAACGYVGVQCTNLKCRSWRVTLHRTKTATLWCFGCDSEFPRTLEKLPLLRGVPMDRSGVF
jgi:type IV pilus biogenesis protein CpaD/CtpE